MANRLTLIGYRACGKSTVGRLAAARLGWPFIDADHVLEERLGCSISAFFARHGEAAFRDHEEAIVAELLAGPAPLVLATGGGAVIRPATRTCLKTHGGLVVWLQATPALVQDRLRRNLGGRPSLSSASPVDEAPRIMAEREGWYREVATAILDATQPAQELADALVRMVTEGM
jgi:shikimate kinase